MRITLARLGMVAVIVGALAGCGGSDGGGGDPGTAPPPSGALPPAPVPPGNAPINIAQITPQQFEKLQPKIVFGGAVVSSAPRVSFAVQDQFGNPIIGLGTRSQSATATIPGYTLLAFSMAKLVPGDTATSRPSRWTSYIVTTVPTKNATTGAITPSAPTRPTTDNTGTLVDNGNGTYVYTFYRDVPAIKGQVDGMTVTAPNNKADLDDLTFDPSLVHRLAIQLAGFAPGYGNNNPDGSGDSNNPLGRLENPVDAIYDFIPASGRTVNATDPSRDIVATAKCEECHRKLGGIPGDSSAASPALFHGGARNETKYCVVCHTDQRRYGRTEATISGNTFSGSTYVVDGRTVGNLPNFIHKTHLGGKLAKKNYNYGGVVFNEVHYSMDIRNCTKCHDGSSASTARTANGDNFKNNPSRLACGACHDGINFATGRGVTLADAAKGLTVSEHGHVGGAQADDSVCKLCHSATAIDTVYHLPVTPMNQQSALHVQGGSANTNSAWIASNTSRLPAGAIKISYEISSVSVNASGNPVMVFRILQNGVRADLLNFATAPVSPATGQKEIYANFMGAPSVYFVFAVPQDGIAQPADFNATASVYLRSLWNNTASGTSAGTLSVPDANGFYTATITGVTIPANARMLTGGLGYSYNVRSTLPLTQTNLVDYPTAASPVPVGSGSTELIAGMPNRIGGLIVIAPNVQRVATNFTARRVIVADALCNKCHQELGAFTEEAFHGGQRNDGTTCSWCHTPNRTSSGWSADSTAFVHAIHGASKRGDANKYTWHAISATEGFWQIHYPGVLNDCETCHVPGGYDFSLNTVPTPNNRQYRTVATGTLASTGATYAYSPWITRDVNYGSGFSFNAGTGATTEAAGTTLVTSPITTVCTGCHLSSVALQHIQSNGGSFYTARSSSLAVPEQCMLCHAPGRVADIKLMHSK